MAKRILVTGASGMLGSAVVRAFAAHPTNLVFAQYFKRAITPSTNQIIPLQLDIRDQMGVEKALAECRPDVIVHCAAFTDVSNAAQNFRDALSLNVEATHHLIRSSQRYHPFIVYISSDAIYPDVPEPKSEALTPAPQSEYGLTKLWGEELITSLSTNHMIIRTTIIGNAKGQLFHWLKSSATQGQPLKLFNDVWFSPISVNLLAKIIVKADTQAIRGIYNIASHDKITKADLGQWVIEHTNPGCPWEACSISSIDPTGKRSKFMALDCQKIEAEIGPMPTAKESFYDLI